jgi:hypothetical protein
MPRRKPVSAATPPATPQRCDTCDRLLTTYLDTGLTSCDWCDYVKCRLVDGLDADIAADIEQETAPRPLSYLDLRAYLPGNPDFVEVLRGRLAGPDRDDLNHVTEYACRLFQRAAFTAEIFQRLDPWLELRVGPDTDIYGVPMKRVAELLCGKRTATPETDKRAAKPSKLDEQIYNTRLVVSVNTQADLAKVVSEQLGRPIKQYQVSRSIAKVKRWLGEGNSIQGPAPESSGPEPELVLMDPSDIEMGRNTEGRVERQRHKRSNDD